MLTLGLLTAVAIAFGAVDQWQESRSLRDRLGEAYNDRTRLERMLAGPAEDRWVAASRLGQIRDPQSVGPLVGALRDVPGTGRVCRMCIALGEIGDERAVPDLLRALNDPALSDDVHRCAAEALLKIADPDSVPGLARALKSNTSTLTVVRALGRIGNSDAVSVLRWAAARHPGAQVRREAKAALLRIETRSHAGE